MIGFWKRALTAAERTALYNNGDGLSFARMAAAAPPTTTPTPNPYAGWQDAITATPVISSMPRPASNGLTGQGGSYTDSYTYDANAI